MRIELPELVELLQNNDTFILSTHEGPDADGIASSLALGILLESLGKKVKIYNPDKLPNNLHFLPHTSKVTQNLQEDESFDVALIVDLGDPTRVGKNFAALPNIKKWACVDHHLNGEHPLEFTYLDPKASSSGVLVYRLLELFKKDLDQDLANLIYASLSADTGSFKYSNVNAEALQIASYCVAAGADVWNTAWNLWECQELVKVKLLAKVLSSLELKFSDQVASLTALQEDFASTGALDEHTEGFINHARSIPSVEVAIIFRQIGEARYKISLRSKLKVDVSRLAQQFGGGGHERAAGCKLDGSLAEVKEKLYGAISELL